SIPHANSSRKHSSSPASTPPLSKPSPSAHSQSPGPALRARPLAHCSHASVSSTPSSTRSSRSFWITSPLTLTRLPQQTLQSLRSNVIRRQRPERPTITRDRPKAHPPLPILRPRSLGPYRSAVDPHLPRVRQEVRPRLRLRGQCPKQTRA